MYCIFFFFSTLKISEKQQIKKPMLANKTFFWKGVVLLEHWKLIVECVAVASLCKQAAAKFTCRQ